MGYPNAKQVHSDALRSILMPRIAFEYAREEIWTAEAKGIRIPKDGIRMPETEFRCPRRAFGYTEQVAERRVSGCWKVHPDVS